MISSSERPSVWAGFPMPLAGKGHALRKARNLEQRLWAETGSKMNAANLSDRRVLLVGFPSLQRARLRDMLGEIGVRMIATTGGLQNLGSICDMEKVFGIVIVDFDSFPDTEDGVDALLAFRARSGPMPLLLCSAAVKGDDLTAERSAICDATVRCTVTRERLRSALQAAVENNAFRAAEPRH
jgi:CheY-like chemotaxis protein